jgi:phospholipase C
MATPNEPVIMSRRALSLAFAAATLALTACGGAGDSSITGSLPPPDQHHGTGSTPIQHVVLIVQENRSFDNLFAKFPGANGATRGKERIEEGSKYIDKWVTLKPEPLVIKVNPYDLSHCRPAFLEDYDNGKMDGFNIPAATSCGSGKPAGLKPYHYVTTSDIQPYWDIADEWVLADAMFQTQGSGSFTAHQDLIRGGTCIQACVHLSNTTKTIVDNPTYWPWGCDAPKPVVTHTVNIHGVEKENGPYPCSKNFPDYSGYDTLGTRLDTAGISWKYYTPCFNASLQPGCSPSSDCLNSGKSSVKPNCNGSLLDAFDVIWPVRNGPEWGTNVSWPETNIFSDISNGALPAVSWVIPEDANSDHLDQPCMCDYGPSWVASVVNAVGESSYWKSSVIVVVWDDWGGFYDNAVPPRQDKEGGLGFRVPMLVISPYAIAGTGSQGGYISHTQYEFGSILKYIEENWDLPSLGTTDQRATSIGDMFNYSQSPRQFKSIPSQHSPKFFISQPHVVQHGDPD